MKRNRTAGHAFERDIVNHLKKIGFHDVSSSRLSSRLRDSQKIDIVNKDEDANGRLQYNIQCKCTVQGQLSYAKTLEELPEVPNVVNVVLHKTTKKSPAGKFMHCGSYAFLSLDDFMEMVRKLHAYEKGGKP